MDKKKLEYFKKRLETRQVELRRMVTRTEQDGRTVDEDSAQDIADRAASSYTKEFFFHQSNNDRQLLQMVDGALERLREGEFGECIACGKEINAKRLEAVPWTRHCIECQEKAGTGNSGRDLALVAGVRKAEPPDRPAAFVFQADGLAAARSARFASRSNLRNRSATPEAG